MTIFFRRERPLRFNVACETSVRTHRNQSEYWCQRPSLTGKPLREVTQQTALGIDVIGNEARAHPRQPNIS
jgi:hypothetical protein